MSAMPPHDLLRQWASENIPVEMAIGHMLQHMVKLQESIDTLKATVATLRSDLAAYQDHQETKSVAQSRPKARPTR